MALNCRGCKSDKLFDAIDLGNIPVAGEFLLFEDQYAPLIETKMQVCSDCGLGQTSVDLDPAFLFVNYNWRTSTSKSYVEYAKKYANKIIKDLDIKKTDWVLEIASNDGYMLKNFKAKGIGVLGVDPARNISNYAICDGIPVITDFFNAQLAREIVELKGYPKLVIANNVMAHTPDIRSFMEGLSIVAGPETTITIENPTIMNILEKDHFDIIFHEHYSYLSANAVDSLSSEYELKLFKIDHVDAQGGSNRYWISKSDVEIDKTVTDLIDYENAKGLKDKFSWYATSSRINEKIKHFVMKLQRLNADGKIVCGYTASAKSTVLLNFAGVKPDWIKVVADDVKEKQNRFIPGLQIKIVDMETMFGYKPTDIVVFSWNIYKDIKEKIQNAGYPNINVWVWNE